MPREPSAGTSTRFLRVSAATRRTASLAEVLEAVSRESKIATVYLEKERTTLGASAAAELIQQPQSTSRCKKDSMATADLATKAGKTSFVSILLLVTVSVVTVGFMISAVVTGRYISSGAAFGSGRGEYGSDLKAVPSRNFLAPAHAPALSSGGTAEELEAEELARRYMVQPDDPASSGGGVVEAGPATEPFRGMDGADTKSPAVTGRTAGARTSTHPAPKQRTDDGVPPTTSNYTGPPGSPDTNASASGQRLNFTVD